MAIERFDLSEYDLIISSSWAVAKGVKTTKKQLHICYCHTPVRYAWDLYDEYTSSLGTLKKLLVVWTLKRLKKWDIETLKSVNYFVANSHYVKERIKKTYGRDAKVIYPPVDIVKFTCKMEKENFYLCASRLVPYKKTKLIVEAFNTMPTKKLVVIGSGEEYDEIKKIAKNNITVLGYQKDDVLIEMMQRAKAFVYAAVEDFGIVPIEAMACGTPVIALNEGGTKETVIDGVNGLHFNKQSVDEICNAVEIFEAMTFDVHKVRESSLKYANFKNDFKCFVDNVKGV
jgi:glycosyltransferase involved in cell wall biosynthesis